MKSERLRLTNQRAAPLTALAAGLVLIPKKSGYADAPETAPIVVSLLSQFLVKHS